MPSPLFLFVSSSPTLSTHQTRPSTPCACTTTFIFASTQQDKLRKKPRKFARIPHYVRGVMQIKKLKVRPQKSTRSLPLFPHFFSRFLFFFFFFTHLRGTNPHHPFHAIDPPVVLCGPQLASMLGCWAATKDVKSIGACREHAQTLFECMRTAVRLLSSFCFVSLQGTDDLFYCARQPMKRKQHRPSINYHLARLGKTLKD